MGTSGFDFSWPSLLLDEVEGRGPGDPRRLGGDKARGGGEDDRMEEIRGDSGPWGDKGGDCRLETALLADPCRLGEGAAEAFEEIELKAPSSFRASPDSTPPKASSKEIPAEGSGDLAVVAASVEGAGVLAKASSNENDRDGAAGAGAGALPLATELKASPKPVGFPAKGEDTPKALPLGALGGGGKLGVAVVAVAKSKLSSNAVSKEKSGAWVPVLLVEILPIASSNALTSAILGAAADKLSTGNGFVDLPSGAPKASTEGALTDANEDPRLPVGIVVGGLGVCKLNVSPEADSPNASSNEVEGMLSPFGAAARDDTLSTEDCSLCLIEDNGSSSSLSESDSSISFSLSGPLRSVSSDVRGSSIGKAPGTSSIAGK